MNSIRKAYIVIGGVALRPFAKILIDTGADINLIGQDLVDRDAIDASKKLAFHGVGGKMLETLGEITMPVKFGSIQIISKFNVVKRHILGEHDIFLGTDFIRENKLVIDYNKMKVLFPNGVSVDLISDVEVRTIKSKRKIQTKKRNRIERRNSNGDEKEVSKCSNCSGGDRSNSGPEALQCNRVESEVKNFELSHLDNVVEQQILSVLDRYPKVFSDLSKDEFPSLQFDSLNLTSNQPIQSKIYRFPEIHKEMVLHEMKKLLELGVISHSRSHFNSPVWVVSKKDDAQGNKQWRVVIDFRALNKITVPDRFPLPNISDIIDQLGKAKYFSVLDLTSGFHQIELRPEDRYKTGFTVCGNLYEYNRLPFGLINAAPAFQRIMSRVLEGLVGKICFVYIDDIVIYGNSLQEHINNLNVVLRRLDENKLKVKPSKCHFLKSQISYLGYVISPDGVKMDPKKTEAIMKFVSPKNEKQLKSFLGLAGFYRKFIPAFSAIAEPLHKLLRKDVIFAWNEECEAAFRKLINVIALDITLQYPDFNKDFYLTCDASNFGIGAVLSQKNDEGLDQPIAFISRSLNKCERNYSTTEKECLAILWSITEFRNYLYGRPFIILSDHRPLVWLDSVKDPGARLLRWRLKLNDYDYRIQYIEGKLNYVADELSRNGYGGDNPYVDDKIIPTVLRVDAADESDEENESDDELEFEALDTIPKDNRIKITDPHEIKLLIKEQHCGPIGGHRGVTATTNVMKIYYDIKGLRKMVKEVIGKCEICQRNKYDRQNRTLPLSLTTTSNEPNEKIAFDVIGPFKYPNGSKLYGLTIQDDFTKYIMFCGIKDCTAENVAKALVENWILYLGIPKILLSDNGSNLCGEVMTAIANYFNIKRITTSIAHPQSNGSVERAHARLAEFIRSTESEIESSLEWSSKLKIASYCYNTTIHSSTGYSPYYLMFGRHPRLITSFHEEIDLLKDTYLDKFNSNLKDVWQRAKDNLCRKKELEIKRNEISVKRRVVQDFKVGDEVLVKTQVFKGRTNRTEPIWMGPYKVVEVRDCSVLIKKRNRTSVINKGDCKIFVPDSP